LTVQCTAVKRNGGRCTLPANGPQGLCWAHDPANAEKRRRGASRGGKAKANREIPAIKAQLQDLTRDVLAGDLETGRAAVANQLINTRLRAIELERKVREQEEVLERLEALEQQRQGGSGWPA
jgi:septal ring factor EnvC (AmiA/AmiB activator)